MSDENRCDVCGRVRSYDWIPVANLPVAKCFLPGDSVCQRVRAESLAAELAQVKAERDAAVGLVRPRAKMPVGLMDVPEQLEWQRNALAFLARIASGEPEPTDGAKGGAR